MSRAGKVVRSRLWKYTNCANSQRAEFYVCGWRGRKSVLHKNRSHLLKVERAAAIGDGPHTVGCAHSTEFPSRKHLSEWPDCVHRASFDRLKFTFYWLNLVVELTTIQDAFLRRRRVGGRRHKQIAQRVFYMDSVGQWDGWVSGVASIGITLAVMLLFWCASPSSFVAVVDKKSHYSNGEVG